MVPLFGARLGKVGIRLVGFYQSGYMSDSVSVHFQMVAKSG